MMRETFAFKLLFAAEVSYVICMNMFRKLMWLRGIYIFMYNIVLESYAISSRIFDYWLRIYELHSDGGDMGQRLGRLMSHMATVEISGMAAWLMGLERCHPLENVILQSEYTNMWGKTFNDEFSRMNLFDKYTYIEIVAIFQHALQMIRMKSWWMWNGWANLIRNSQLNFTLFDFNVKFRLFEFRNVV